VFASSSNQPSTVKIFNMYGDLILTERMQPNNSYSVNKIDMSEFTSGVYMIELSDGDHIGIKKIIKQ
jgi:hypothetical protein